MIAHAGGDAPAQELDAAQFEAHLQQRLEEQQHQVMDGGREVGWLGCTTIVARCNLVHLLWHGFTTGSTGLLPLAV